MLSDEILIILSSNIHLIVVSCFGGIVLAMVKIAEHFNRPVENKITSCRYIGYVLFFILGMPILGGGVTIVYLINGDQISSLLSFQIGLTSPAIIQTLIAKAANNLAKETEPIIDNSQ